MFVSHFYDNLRSLSGLFFCLFVALAVLPLPAAKPPKSAPVMEPERVSWKGKIAAGLPLTVVNDFGDVRARFGGYEGMIEMQAVVQNLQADGPQLKVNTVADDKGVSIIVAYDKPITSTANASPRRDRVDLVVFVPEKTPLSVTTRAGLIELRGLKNGATAATESGEVTLRSCKGSLKIRNDRGATSAVLELPEKESPLQFDSLTGDITLYLPPAAQATVNAATSGEISTDFSIQITPKPHAEPNKEATMQLGNGGVPVQVNSKRGRIRLLTRPDFNAPLPESIIVPVPASAPMSGDKP